MSNVRWPSYGWRRWLVIAAAVLGAACSLPLVLAHADDLEATLTVYVDPDVARASANSNDPAAQQVLMDAFLATATSDGAVRTASKSADLDPSAIKDRLKAQQVGTSNAAVLSMTTTSALKGRETLQAVAGYALKSYAETSRARLASTVKLFEAAYTRATGDLNAYLTQVGDAAPDAHYESVRQQLIAAGVSSSQASPGAAQQLQVELDRLSPIVIRYRELLAAQTRAGNILQQAQQDSLQLEAIINGAAEAPTGPVAIAPAPELGPALRDSALAGLACGLLAAAFILLFSLFSSRRGGLQKESTASTLGTSVTSAGKPDSDGNQSAQGPTPSDVKEPVKESSNTSLSS